MAGLECTATVRAVTSGTTSRKTLIQILAPTNQRLKVKSFGVYGNGVSSSAEPLLVELVEQTTAGTLTALAELPIHLSAAETPQAAATGSPVTAEPTSATDPIDVAEHHPQGGYERAYAPDREIIVGGGKRVAVVVTAAAAVNVTAKIEWEE